MVLGSSGPSFITAQGADKAYRPVPLIGFAVAMSTEVAQEMQAVGPVLSEAFARLGPWPLLWEGDQA